MDTALQTTDPRLAVELPHPYRAVRLVTSGAYCDVWLGKGDFDVDVCIKIVRDPKDAERLTREARALLKLNHPSIVRMMDRAPDDTWLVLEWVRGEPIDQWARSHSIEDLMKTAMDLVDGLRYMHDQGWIHGDIKPQNILVSESGQPTLLDLGISMHEGDPDRPFQGTLGYAAPELLKGERPTPLSDGYSLGATLYYCLTRQLPFTPDDPAALTYVPLVSLPTPPSTWAPEVPMLLEQAVMKMLARTPENRPSNLTKVRRALQAVPTSRSSRPIVGMHPTREDLRRAVVASADGETRVVVVYGPPGSGRTTLIDEAVEAARREGLAFLRDASPRLLIASVKGAEHPSVAHFQATPDAIDAARQILEGSHRALVLIRSDKPLPVLAEAGADQITPPPMSRADATMLIEALGGHSEHGRTWWREANGLPAGVIGRFRAWRRRRLRERLDLTPLPEDSRRILEALKSGETDIEDLATKLGMGQHALLDHCAILFAEELVQASPDGARLSLVPAES